MPTVAASATGVSRTRSAPNSAKSPSNSRYEPPKAPTSCPMMNTRGFCAISSRTALAIASRKNIRFTAGGGLPDIGQHLRGLGIGRGVRERERFGHLDLRLFLQLVRRTGIKDAGGAKALHLPLNRAPQ